MTWSNSYTSGFRDPGQHISVILLLQAAVAVAAVAAGIFIYKAVRDEDPDLERHGKNAKGDAKGALNDAKGNAKGAWKEAKGNVKGAFNS